MSSSNQHKRRHFLWTSLAWASSLLPLAVFSRGSKRFLTPKPKSSDSNLLQLQSPDQYAQGWTHLREERVFIEKKENHFRALSAICTHLGCAVNRDQIHEEYHCPCHGSRFDPSGRVLSGPAPQNLPWLKISMDSNGNLRIHLSEHVEAATTFRASS